MNDTLTDDLRRALHERAADIPEADAPGLVLGYTAPSRFRRLPLAVAGTIAAGLVGVALVAGRGGGTTTLPGSTATTASAPATITSSIPESRNFRFDQLETDGTFAGFVATDDHPVIWSTIVEGDAGARQWQLISAEQDGRRHVGLLADGVHPVRSFDPNAELRGSPGLPFLLNTARVAGHTLLAFAVSPSVDVVKITAQDGTWSDSRMPVADPANRDQMRYVVLVAPAVTGKANLRFGSDSPFPLDLGINVP